MALLSESTRAFLTKILLISFARSSGLMGTFMGSKFFSEPLKTTLNLRRWN